MDLSFLGQPAILVFVVSAIVGLIVKAVRLQTRVDAQEIDIKELHAANGELKGMVTAHRENTDIHFNVRVAQEVDKGNERRFQSIERQLTEVINKLDKIASKQ